MKVDYIVGKVIWQIDDSELFLNCKGNMPLENTPPSPQADQHTEQRKPVEPAINEEPKKVDGPRKWSRRAFGGIIAKGAVIVGAAAAMHGEFDRQAAGVIDDFTVALENSIEKKAVKIVTDENPIPVLKENFVDVTTESNRVFSLADIPSADADFPALVLKNDEHIDRVKPNKSAWTRIKKWAHDLPFFRDRMYAVLIRGDEFIPAIKIDEEMRSLNRVFFRAQETSVEQLREDLANDFHEFPLGNDILQAIIDGEISLYTHNFGSRLGRGKLPNFFLIKK